jgi:hypothetical protein
VKIVVNHLTRMQPGYICVAGIDPESNTHIRPVLGGRRLTTNFLKRHGGPFDIGVVVDLGKTHHRESPPEVEDHLFDASHTAAVGELGPDKFWRLLKAASRPDLVGIFGSGLQAQGRGCAVDVGTGSASLGCLAPTTPPHIEIDAYDKVRMSLADGNFTVYLSLTDLRLYHQDQKTPRVRIVRDVQRRIGSGVRVVLSLGLARAWLKPGDTARRHWLQINNVHLEDDPAWQAK